MAAYSELRGLFNNSELKNKVEVACIVAAEAIMQEDTGTTNHSNRLVWAKKAFEDPNQTANGMLMALLAQNKDQTTGVITGASDAQIQTNVDTAVDLFADGN